MQHTWLNRAALTAAMLMTLGCESTEPSATIAVSLGSATLELTQSATAQVLVTVTRTDFTEAIALAVTSLPVGVSGEFAPATLTDPATTSTLTLTATAAAVPGNASVTITATGVGVDASSTTLTLTVLVAGTYDLTVDPTARIITQGSSGTATVTLARAGGFSQDVTLAASGLPSGVTAVFAPPSVSGTSSVLTLSAAAGATVGSATVTITGTTPGLANETTTLALTVQAPGTTTSFTADFCEGQGPAWMAFRNDGATSWTRLIPDANGTVSGQVTERVTFAIAFDLGAGEYEHQIIHTTVTEMAAVNGVTCVPQEGSKTLNGTVANVPEGQHSTAQMAYAYGHTDPPSNSYILQSLPTGALDLVASRAPLTTSIWHPNAIIIRRALDIAANGDIPVLDFGGAEAFAPATSTLNVGGTAGADGLFATLTMFTNATGTSVTTEHELWFEPVGGTSTTFSAVPASKLAVTDLHELSVQTSSGSDNWWMAATYFRDPANQTLTLGPQLTTPTFTVVATSPYVRYRMQLPAQAEYGGTVVFQFDQLDRRVAVIVTSGYLGGTPATWDITMPDFSAVEGWQNAFGLQAAVATDRFAHATSASIPITDELPPAGSGFIAAARLSSATPGMAADAGGRSGPRLGVGQPLVRPFVARAPRLRGQNTR